MKIKKEDYDILMLEFEKMKEKMLKDIKNINDPMMRHTFEYLLKQFDNLVDLAKKSIKENVKEDKDDESKTRSSKKKRSGKKNKTKKD